MTIERIHFYLLLIFLCLRLIRSEHITEFSAPVFDHQLVEGQIPDGYWIEAFKPNAQTPVGFMTSGLARGEIKFYPNPHLNRMANQSSIIATIITPVGLNQADISGDGHQDIILSNEYGSTIINFNVNGGHIIWLENPGSMNGSQPWRQHYVGRSPTMHRVVVGHFTQNRVWEIIGLPVVNGPFDVPVPAILFRQPENVLTATAWECEIIDNTYFHLIHDYQKFQVGSLEHLVMATREGLTWLYYDQTSSRWILENIHEGEQRYKEQTNFYGTGGVAIGKTPNDSFAYIATFEPFHGNVIAVYTKTTTNESLTQIKWQRHVLDVFGYPNENGEGPAHHIVSADFDKDGTDEFIVALRGPAPDEGIFYYKPVDLSRGQFSKWQVSNHSAARIAVADFDNDSYVDFATIGYQVPGYYNAENPGIFVFYNRIHERLRQAQIRMQVSRQNNELSFKIPRPDQVNQYQAIPIIAIDGTILSLEMIPPYSSRHIENNAYVKVLYGRITWMESVNGTNSLVERSRDPLCEPRRGCSLEIRSNNNRIRTGNTSTLIMVFQLPVNRTRPSTVSNIRSVSIENVLPENTPDDARALTFSFIKVEELSWGNPFRGLEFYNMKGFNISFADNDENLFYLQLWAAGRDTDCGVHNHRQDRFCEVHVTLVNGYGDGGMHYLNSSNQTYNPNTTRESDFIKLPLPAFHEHGPLWDTNQRGEPILRTDGTVVYPWHKWQAGGNQNSTSSSSPPVSNPSSNGESKVNSPSKILKALKGIEDCGSRLDQAYDIWLVYEFNNRYARL